MKFTEAQKEEIKSMIGEGFHTAFRKGTHHPKSGEIWGLIQELPNSEWSNIVDWVAEPLIEMLEGYEAGR